LGFLSEHVARGMIAVKDLCTSQLSSASCPLPLCSPMLQPPTREDLKPKKHHGYNVVLFIFGTLFPPLGMLPSVRHDLAILIVSAVAARFGFGGDFWLNLFLTICGYIPGMISTSPSHQSLRLDWMPQDTSTISTSRCMFHYFYV